LHASSSGCPLSSAAQECCSIAFLDAHSIEQCGKEDPFLLIAHLVSYLAWYHTSWLFTSSCTQRVFARPGEGAEEAILPLSLVSARPLAAGFLCQQKCLAILQSCCPSPGISSPFGILDKPQQPLPSSTSHKAESVGPDSVFPLFTAERHRFSRVRALHICTESNRMWSTCSDGVKLFEGVF